MLISQGPLRVSLFGGGSDLPAFLSHNDGAVLSFAIDKRVFIVGHPFTHRSGILLKYAQTEDVKRSSELKHPIARVVLGRYGIDDIDVAVMSDVPAGTGLGSSSSFTTALLAFARHLTGNATSPEELAREACEIEIDVLGEPIGYQDQWASALGGINVLSFAGSEVDVDALQLPESSIAYLEQHLRLIPVGAPRRAGALLANQGDHAGQGSASEALTRQMVSLVVQGRAALEGPIDDIGPLLHEAWVLKRALSTSISSPEVDMLYDKGISSGATGGKLLGAGGSGYFAFYVPPNASDQFTAHFPHELDFHITHQGAGVIHES